MQVRLKSGLRAGEVIEVEDHVGHAFLASGKADRAEPEVAEAAETLETPEKPATRRRSSRKRQTEPAEQLEVR
jgi:hypothetical protein